MYRYVYIYIQIITHYYIFYYSVDQIVGLPLENPLHPGGLHLTIALAVGCTKRRGPSAGPGRMAMPSVGRPANCGKSG